MKNLFWSFLLIFVISCKGGSSGGSSSSNNNNPENNGVYGTGSTINAILLDAPIKNMSYNSTSYNGVTNDSGQFVCKDGETVSFNLNGIEMGSVLCRSVVTPIEFVTNGSKTVDDGISELTSEELSKLDKFLRVVQALDSDYDLSDGIDISNSWFSDLGIAGFRSFSDFYSASDAVFDAKVSDLVSTLNTSTGVFSSSNVPSASSARSHFTSTLATISTCTTSDVPNSASVTGVNNVCSALTCQAGYTVNSLGQCQQTLTCQNQRQEGVSSVTGNYPDCYALSCNSGFTLSNGRCVSGDSATYYCLSGSLARKEIGSDMLNEFDNDTDLDKKSLKYNFSNHYTGTYANRSYSSATAMFILKPGTPYNSELRVKSGSTVVSIPVAGFGQDEDSNLFYVNGVTFSNPVGMVQNPPKVRYYQFNTNSVYDRLLSKSSGSTIVLDANSNAGVQANWTITRDCNLSTWTVNYE